MRGNAALISDLSRDLLGEGAYLVPALLALLAWRFMRHPDRTLDTPRLAVGWIALFIGELGLVNAAKGNPHPSAGALVIRSSGGFLGFLASYPLVHLVTAWVAIPLLGLAAGFGVLVITATPVYRVPDRLAELWQLFGHGRPPEDYDEDIGCVDHDDDVDKGAWPRRGQIPGSIRLRSSAIELGDHVRPYDTPVLGLGGYAPVDRMPSTRTG